MAAGIIGEGILIVASVIVAGMITGIVITKVGSIEGTFTSSVEDQKDKLLSKFEIIHVNQKNNTSVNVWIKNIGLTPIQNLDSLDVYFGQINSAQYVGYLDATLPGWEFGDSTTPSSVWEQGKTIQVTIQDDTGIQTDQSYEVQLTIGNGVTDDHIFSVS